MKLKIINKSSNPLPSYATEGSAGLDLRSNETETVEFKPFERKLISTGLFIALPNGYEAQIRPRSGLALKKGLSLPNSPGTIDSDYRGEIKVIIINLSNEIQEIEPAERIAQMVICKYEQISWEETTTLTNTERGSGGFGSSGSN